MDFSYTDALLKVFAPVDTIYIYDGFGNIDIEKNTLTFLESNEKTLIHVNKKWLDSIPLGLRRTERWAYGLTPSDSTNFTGGFLSRYKPFKKYSAVCYVKSKELSSIAYQNYMFFKRSKPSEISYYENDEVYNYGTPPVGLSCEKTISWYNLKSDSIFKFHRAEFSRTINRVTFVPRRIFFKPRFSFSTFGNIVFSFEVSRKGEIKSYIVIDPIKNKITKEHIKQLPKLKPPDGYEYLW